MGALGCVGLRHIRLLVEWRFVWALPQLDRHQRFAGAIIAGGAIGNAIDRLRFGRVVDFIDFHIGAWHWPAFNVADTAITIGAGLWALAFCLDRDRRDMTRQSIEITIAVMIALGLSACSDFRRSIGKEKSKPDEFQVVCARHYLCLLDLRNR